MINLGDYVKDQISGFEGIVTGKANYISGCEQVLVEGAVASGDRKTSWIDVQRLEVVTAGSFKVGQPGGGPQHSPPRR